MRPPRRPTRPHADLIARVKADGDAGAAYLLVRLVEPSGLEALLRVVIPRGNVPAGVFDLLADAYALWLEGEHVKNDARK